MTQIELTQLRETIPELDAVQRAQLESTLRAMLGELERISLRENVLFQIHRARAVLYCVEWSMVLGVGDCCPYCKRLKQEGHAPGCELAAFLRDTDDVSSWKRRLCLDRDAKA